VVSGDTVAAAFGEDFHSTVFDRACHRLSDLGLVTIISNQRNGTAEKGSTLLYGIPLMTHGESG
jgi:hypothetical protein